MSIVTLHVSCSTSAVKAERRFAKDTVIGNLKTKLEIVVGVPAANMKLVLKDEHGKTVCELGDDSAMLGAYPAEDFMQLHVVNLDPTAAVGEFEDLSKVEKFEMADEEYEKRSGTVQDFKRKNQLGRFNPDYDKQVEAKEKEGEEQAAAISVGSRCEVELTGGKQRGTVRFVGRTQFKPGYWVGVELDEPYGKNDGSVEGHKYFQCQPKYGCFARPAAVTVGDFPPELDLDDDLEEM